MGPASRAPLNRSIGPVVGGQVTTASQPAVQHCTCSAHCTQQKHKQALTIQGSTPYSYQLPSTPKPSQLSLCLRTLNLFWEIHLCCFRAAAFSSLHCRPISHLRITHPSPPLPFRICSFVLIPRNHILSVLVPISYIHWVLAEAAPLPPSLTDDRIVGDALQARKRSKATTTPGRACEFPPLTTKSQQPHLTRRTIVHLQPPTNLHCFGQLENHCSSLFARYFYSTRKPIKPTDPWLYVTPRPDSFGAFDIPLHQKSDAKCLISTKLPKHTISFRCYVFFL